jgi:hypothetical protein
MSIETDQRQLCCVKVVCLCEGQDGVSASGHKRTSRHRPALARLVPRADIRRQDQDVGKGQNRTHGTMHMRRA